ncbi:nuclear transport factor 2 [Impatiens glandulifera]|uniref:nuclear transport factor 2 n=1 Tax=Impatiens glandulifera TaxID=253017 RepID=UPI001FB0B5D1|nr:nuclear transport factor 2 [Impatiens glandulifera]
MAVAWLVSAQFVANAFVEQYYKLLHQSPALVHKFYQDNSMLGRPGEDGSMIITSTMEAINAKILSLNYGDFSTEIKSFSAQESYYGGVHVLVTGFLIGKDNSSQSFTQTFFLAPHEKGYYVLNDMFYYVEKSTYSSNGSHASYSDAESLLDQERNSSQVDGNPVSTRALPSTEVTSESEGIPFDIGKVTFEEDKEEGLDPETAVDESMVDVESDSTIEEDLIKSYAADVKSDDSVVVVESVSIIEEDPKKSYAADVKSDDSAMVVEPISRIVEDSKKSYAAIVMDRKESVTMSSHLLNPGRPLASEAQSNASGINKKEEEGSDRSYSIYVKGLPLTTTTTILEGVFKDFGPIKSGGIQIIRNKLQQQGFCFGFVEFEVPDAVEKALQASPIIIGGRRVYVEEKRSNHSGATYRGHFPGGSFRDEKCKYNNNRNEFGNNKRGYGDQRTEHNYGRMNRNHQVFVVRKKSATA